MKDLHITNGDSAAGIIKACGVGGDVISWRDPMHEGPFPEGSDLDELAQIRGEYLVGPNHDPAQAIRDFHLRDDHLRASPKYDRVTLWFEHDLLDQLQILQLLDWFHGATLGDTRLEMICINEFDGIEGFKGIGQLSPVQMASLTEQRRRVTREQMDLGRRGWAAFRCNDPRELMSFINEDLAPLPFLRATLVRHLQELPDSVSGLGLSHARILNLVHQGIDGPEDVFLQSMALESVYFMGDWQSFRRIGELCDVRVPLLKSLGHEPYWHPPEVFKGHEEFRAQRLGLTDEGLRVLEGKRDAFDMLETNQWFGGVHLQSGKPMWTWNAESSEPQLRQA